MDSTIKKLCKMREREESGLISQHAVCTPRGWTCCFLEWGHLGVLLCHTKHKAPFRHLGGWRVQDGEHMYTCGGFISIYSRTNTIL